MYNLPTARITKDFFWRIGYTLAKQGLLFIIFILSAKELDITTFGNYDYIVSAISFLVLLSDFGISTATSKYVAQYNSSSEKEKIEGIVFNILLVLFLASSFIFIVFLFFGKFYFKDNYFYALYLFPLIFLVPATSVFDGVYRGLRKFRESALITITAFCLSILFVIYLIIRYKVLGSIISQDIFYITLFLIYIFNHKDFNFKLKKSSIYEISKYSLLYGVAVVSYQVFSKIDILFLGHYGYIAQIATYDLLNKLFSVLLIPFTLLGQVIAPRFTELYYIKKDIRNIYYLLKKYTIYSTLISIFLSVICFFLMPFFIKLFLPKYINIIFYQIFILSLIIFALNVSAAIIDHGIIIATGHAKLMTWIYLALGVLNIILNYLLIPLFGYRGSIYATVICSVLMVFVLRIAYFIKIKKEISISEA